MRNVRRRGAKELGGNQSLTQYACGDDEVFVRSIQASLNRRDAVQ